MATTPLKEYLSLNGKSITKEDLRSIKAKLSKLPEKSKAVKSAISEIDRKLKKEGRLGKLVIGKGVQQAMFDEGLFQTQLNSPTKEEPAYALWVDLKTLNVDPKRFQNRVNAFSEISAQSVADNLNWNIFDPIIAWIDPKDKKTYILSGHSRFEGLKRRGEKKAPVRFFDGTEAEAIRFSKVDANRSATAENLVEDLRAYLLARDGDATKKIEPVSTADLKKAFKGKWAKLEDLSSLDKDGAFIRLLGQENTSEYPYIERLGRWVGQLRKLHPEITNVHEFNIFNWAYDDKAKGYKLDEPTFKGTILKRLSTGKKLLFDCTPKGCEGETKTVEKFLKTTEEKRVQKVLETVDKDLGLIRKRLATKTTSYEAVFTPEERNFLIGEAGRLEEKRNFIIKEHNIKVTSARSLFGIPNKRKITRKRTVKK